MFKKVLLSTYILLLLNFNSFADENKNVLKIGLLAPFSGEYRDIGQSIMFSLQLGLSEIGDDNVKIYPRDSGFNDEDKLINSIKSLKEENIKVVIGPINYDEFKTLSGFKSVFDMLI